jgi:hypothetical protein
MSLSIPSDPKDETKMMTITLDPMKKGVKVALVGSCDSNKQGIALTWEDTDTVNKNNTMSRMVAMTFLKTTENNDTGSYGLSSIMGMAEVV